jgi:CrcB protein
MEYIFVGIGGALGSIVRFAIGKTISENSKLNFPFGTFIINSSGAFLLGIVSSISLSKNVALLISYGFLGAYTTFSTFMYEGFNLVQENEKLNAFIYITGSIIAGIIGFILGIKTTILLNFI